MSLPFDKNKWSRSPYVRASDFFDYIHKGNKSLRLATQNVVISWSQAWARQWAKSRGLSWNSFMGYSYCEIQKENTHLFTSLGMGGPSAAVFMEQLICAGAENFITIGTAGALNPSLNIGDIVIGARSLRDEGTSYHYLPPGEIYVETCQELLASTEKKLSLVNLEHSRGVAWTTDAPFRETREEILRYQKMNVDVVDMESATMYAVAKHHSKKALSLFVISDLLYEQTWTPYFKNKKLRSQYMNLLTAQLNCEL